MGMTYVCEKCGASLHRANAHVCQMPDLTTFNIHQDCLDESTFREQLAKEIMALECYDFINLKKTLVDHDAVLNLVRGNHD